MSTEPYEHVEPYEHDASCHRGTNPSSPGALDTTHCARCRALDARIGGTSASCPIAYRPVSRPTPEELNPAYREAMIDAGRGHLLP